MSGTCGACELIRGKSSKLWSEKQKGKGYISKYLAKRMRIGIFSLARIQILTLVNTVINFPVPQTPGLRQSISSADHLHGFCYMPAHTKIYTIKKSLRHYI